MQLSADCQAVLLDAARDEIRRRLRGEAVEGAAPPALPHAELQQPAGCFVSLHELLTHRLRGCVGRIEAKHPLWRAVRDAAENVLCDPRFEQERVTLGELPSLEIEVTVLSAPCDASHPLDFDPPVEGIYLTIGDRTGCFLPQVARETGWTREQLLDRLCAEKLHLPPRAWREGAARLQKFTTLIIGPAPFQVG